MKKMYLKKNNLSKIDFIIGIPSLVKMRFDHTYTMRSVGEYMRIGQHTKEKNYCYPEL